MKRSVLCGLLVVSVILPSYGASADSWPSAMQPVAQRFSGTSGVVLHVGDEMTYSGAYGNWARAIEKPAADQQILDWMHTNAGGDTDGWSLASYDVMEGGKNLYHSYTAASGIRADDLLRGPYKRLPSFAQMLRKYNPQIVVLLVGSNDAQFGRTSEAYIADLQRAVELCLDNGTIPILTTLPPNNKCLDRVQAYNREIVETATLYRVPLIDYYAEILKRHPEDWNGTLIQKDNLQPTASDNWDPKQGGLDENGYLLRCWLTVQKIKEVKAKAINPVVPASQSVAAIGKLE